MANCTPFIKWAGGKRRVVSELEERLPKKFNRYFEPFIGGGASLFHLQIEKSYISDVNEELINLYKTIRDSLDELIEDLSIHQNSAEYFYSVRSLDRDQKVYSQLSDVERASRFIYLNKSCYNGLYRVNSKGQFNTPFGKYKNPIYFERENMERCSKFLKSVDIRVGDFTIFKDEVREGDFFYFDPPYFPITDTANFTSYTKDGFGFHDQERLLNFAKEIDKKGSYFMISNSHSQETSDFYSEFNIDTIDVGRAINSKGDSRGKIKEILVTNY
jgi:DNA adenine methylase